ncbi:MAG TPA: hypothetical protein PK717_07300 [Caldisericia bacterium]|nr:hypothetical protein [Caldisericia bacterium]
MNWYLSCAYLYKISFSHSDDTSIVKYLMRPLDIIYSNQWSGVTTAIKNFSGMITAIISFLMVKQFRVRGVIPCYQYFIHQLMRTTDSDIMS